MKKLTFYLPLLALIGTFLLIKLSSLGIRASDTNIYFYTGKELLKGQLLYKDIFFTNFPLVPYVAAFYYAISGGNLVFYYFTAAIEASLTACLIFLIVYKEFHSRLYAALTCALYLFSFMLLATSDHQSGVFLAALLSVLSYYFYQKKKFTLVGVTIALTLLAKAYTLPLFLTYLIIFLVKQRNSIPRVALGGFLGIFSILLPTLVLAFSDFWRDVFLYSLTRSQGLEKSGIVWFTLQHDFLFIIFLVTNILFIRKRLFFGLFSLLGLLFFFLYQDTYYLYLNTLLPLTFLSVPYIIKDVSKKISFQPLMIPTIILPFLIYNLLSYFSGFNSLQKLPDTQQLIRAIQAEKPSRLYGVNSITPALSHLSGVPLLNGIIDTNDNIFRKGYLNATTITQDAIKQHALIVTEGAFYPAAQVTQPVLTEIVDKKLLEKNCQLKNQFFFRSEGITNTVNFFRC